MQIKPNLKNIKTGGVVDVAKPIIEEEIARKLEIKRPCPTSPNGFWVADFGCSTGHNSFPAMQIVTQAIYGKHASSGLITPEVPELFVVFNDVITNDFNTLFTSLPPYRNFNAIGVPGDFHGRLLPESSLHLICLLFLGTPLAYAGAKGGGGKWFSGLEQRGNSVHKRQKGSLCCLLESGRSSEAKVDSFNLPFYFITPEQLKAILERSHNITIERLEILNNSEKHTLPTVEARATCFRAVYEGLLRNHFRSEIIDELFHMYTQKLAASPIFSNLNNDKSIVILVVLKRSD
ncbi:UNVERIFIED_CONTAM: Loganic acid O-methyltransferase [Sesamum latifolium]|uniref:Loganic acid O-methyltransferase n=1 Tax=Sesamum latifolium TaxID=2727402 RepID=A0AAW2YC93_9LAMI